jgi:hypothetical protein
VDGEPKLAKIRKDQRECKGIVNRPRGGQAAVSERPKPGAREGVAGRGSSIDGRHSRPSLRHARSRGRVGVGLGGSWESLNARASGASPGEATGVSEARSARIATGRQRPPRWHTRGIVRPAEANRLPCKQAISPATPSAKAPGRQREPTRRGCWYEDVKWQKSVRRIARRDLRRAVRQVGGVTLAKEHSALRADTRGGGSEARTVRVPSRGSQPREPCDGAVGQGNRVESWHDGRRSDRCSGLHRKVQSDGGLGRAGQSASQAARLAVRAASRRVHGTGERCPRGRRGASEIGDTQGKGYSSR